jgi:hypothetical protein
MILYTITHKAAIQATNQRTYQKPVALCKIIVSIKLIVTIVHHNIIYTDLNQNLFLIYSYLDPPIGKIPIAVTKTSIKMYKTELPTLGIPNSIPETMLQRLKSN